MVTATGSVPPPPPVGVRCGDPYGALYQVAAGRGVGPGWGPVRVLWAGFCGGGASQRAGVPVWQRSVGVVGGRRSPAGDLGRFVSGLCHRLATTLRRFCRAGGDVYMFEARCREVIASCGIGSFLGVLAPSSVVTERPDWTPGRLPTSKKARSPEKRRRTGPRSTTSGCGNWNVSRRFTSTRGERLRCLRQRFGPASKPPPAS